MLSWITFKYKGIVSESCWPYASGEGKAPKCPWFSKKCADGSEYKKYYAASWKLFKSVQEIKENL